MCVSGHGGARTGGRIPPVVAGDADATGVVFFPPCASAAPVVRARRVPADSRGLVHSNAPGSRRNECVRRKSVVVVAIGAGAPDCLYVISLHFVGPGWDDRVDL